MKNRLYTAAIVLLIGLLAACSADKGVGGGGHQSAFPLTVVSSSTSGVTVEWSKDKGDNSNYTVNVYTDIEHKELYQTIPFTIATNGVKRFSVPYLDCVNEFHIQVEDSNGNLSESVSVILDNTPARRVVLSQNFDGLFWGYDYINNANGVKLNSDIRPGSYNPESLLDARNDSQPTTTLSDDGGVLFNFNKKLVTKMGFEGWSGSEVRIRPGYAKIGSAYSVGKLVSPAFEPLGERVESVNLSFKACIYSSTYDAAAGSAKAAIIKGDGTTLWESDLQLSSVNSSAKWKEFSFQIDNVSADCHFEISSNTTTKQVCIDALQIERCFTVPTGYIYGYVSDKSTGQPIEGVAMSDGFSVVTTDDEGYYQIKPNADAWYVFYSVPAEYEVARWAGAPRFYSRIVEDIWEYNFELRQLPDGKEEKFALFAFADPQVSSNAKLTRFQEEAVPAIKKYVSSMGCPCYGITLGDIISNSSGSNTERFRDEMHASMQYQKMGLPVYQVMGNHDANYYDEEIPIEADEHSSTYNMRAQRAFETTNGPINFSFNRGNVHIVGMRDIVYTSQISMAEYSGGFLDSQYEWLKQDLAVVPKDKTVVLCVHIPLHHYRVLGSINHIGDVHKLLNEFNEAHILSGHTHYNRNAEPSNTFKNVYEHNVGTVCGTWWASNVCGDGTPNGYGVFISEGAGFTEWYYMGYHDGMNDRSYQMRLYRGNAVTGAAMDDNENGTEGYYSFNYGEDVILANVFNADSSWQIKVYEDGEYSGDMKLITTSTTSYKNLTGGFTLEDPRHIKDGVATGNDMWVVGLHLGVLDRYSKTKKEPSNGSWTANTHMYRYQLKDANAQVKVVAIDRFGNQYESDKFVDYRDNKMGLKP